MFAFFAQVVSATSGAEKKVHTILNDASRLSQFDFQILTKGPDDAPESSAYTLKKIPMVRGYDLSSQAQLRAGLKAMLMLCFSNRGVLMLQTAVHMCVFKICIGNRNRAVLPCPILLQNPVTLLLMALAYEAVTASLSLRVLSACQYCKHDLAARCCALRAYTPTLRHSSATP